MDSAQARWLIDLNSSFYRENAKSFGQSRQAAWPGWSTCLEQVDHLFSDPSVPSIVLDVACGNLRFEDYLLHKYHARSFEFYAVDNCEQLQDETSLCGAGAPQSLHFQSLDVLNELVNDWEHCKQDVAATSSCLAQAIQTPPCDLTVSFGFLHHVPRAAWRSTLLQALVEKTRPGGCICVSFWQFMQSESLARKAVATTTQAVQQFALPPSALEDGDYLLGWNGKPGAYRYCHHFTAVEIDALLASIQKAARVVARFTADGRTGNLNEYVVLQRRF